MDTAAADRDRVPGSGPGPRPLGERELEGMLAAHHVGALAAIRRNGRPHLSTVVYDWDAAERTIRVSTTADRLKVRQLRADPRGALYVSSADFRSFVVAEGDAELSSVTGTPGDEVGRELLGMLRPALTGPAEQAAFLEHAVAERRLVIRLRVSRLYGAALDIPEEVVRALSNG
ncbi:TIGR03618 family F420-dependent PPOX class oxidoreductase [Marinitenerispora sediminis]|uniref:PPOX class F420-dependent oxidoreductase n=1 Tax=Marinitenerispora sediminis TaxID=1931232 RepID=A0A368T4Q8_9ACTN|nr:TIGR03618 family F420-dependent PPOX class oxidoreductase [Marinitenerispora sediminis]RCV49899.1 PPOX class F420-dependent oxidoreductase [Marinitenerispora sediminis]RCV54200.1 PPOX class F420-dependent oxidoreductase [Marinitenerispora sediminis]RCV58356.1 PPOX class F420-dependent oxidoreductase [Marinitenerispora sediminis]